jgi:hypothetical protein
MHSQPETADKSAKRKMANTNKSGVIKAGVKKTGARKNVASKAVITKAAKAANGTVSDVPTYMENLLAERQHEFEMALERMSPVDYAEDLVDMGDLPSLAYDVTSNFSNGDPTALFGRDGSMLAQVILGDAGSDDMSTVEEDDDDVFEVAFDVFSDLAEEMEDYSDHIEYILDEDMTHNYNDEKMDEFEDTETDSDYSSDNHN